MHFKHMEICLKYMSQIKRKFLKLCYKLMYHKEDTNNSDQIVFYVC